ncbi:MAG: hypothetical protein KDD15_02280 [Lewinella sp.]|nr:hypothetical protein [Lewinella sp.]
MLKQFLEFRWVFVLVITLGSCEKEGIPTPQVSWDAYIGKWENINAFGSNLDRIIITRKEADRLSVQLWGSCGTQECERGLFSYSSPELKKPTLPLHLLWNKREVPLQLGITTSRKLELRAVESDANAFETEYFSWVQTASFYQQVTPTDAGSVQLADTPINGGPGYPDNHLTSGSILIFQTNERRLGKIQVRSNDLYLSLRWQIWSSDGTIDRSIDYFPFYKSGYYDLDDGKLDDTPDHRYSDFYWSLEHRTIRRLEPVNAAAFALYHLD